MLIQLGLECCFLQFWMGCLILVLLTPFPFLLFPVFQYSQTIALLVKSASKDSLMPPIYYLEIVPQFFFGLVPNSDILVVSQPLLKGFESLIDKYLF